MLLAMPVAIDTSVLIEAEKAGSFERILREMKAGRFSYLRWRLRNFLSEPTRP
jgi:hypothetical protein